MENGRDGFEPSTASRPVRLWSGEVAAKTDTDPLVFPPLYESIDPDAL